MTVDYRSLNACLYTLEALAQEQSPNAQRITLELVESARDELRELRAHYRPPPVADIADRDALPPMLQRAYDLKAGGAKC